MWNIATLPKLAIAAPKCFSSSDPGTWSKPVITGTRQ
jgi:hypothetical protein